MSRKIGERFNYREGAWFNEWKELKHCERCGWVRRVTVCQDKPGARLSGKGAPRFNPLCSACDLDSRAEKHLAEAKRLARKARELRTARSKGKP